ncbi:LytR C-terminal domain-containing protein [Streptomyces sp. KLOTTS4A1]|uniref:LytR C-terminal domain-containing protein n=1 Tax=Streptomyces sp. KLOTTS4A1 TaxID=3390996 RepID=UPI0039F609CA
MNDQYDPYAGQQYEIVGYDEYGQPVYQPLAPPQSPQGGYGQYGGGVPQQQGYGYEEPYGGSYAPDSGYPDNSDYHGERYDSGASGASYGNGIPAAYDPYGQSTGTGQYPPVADTGQYPPVHDTGQYPPVHDTGQYPPVQDAGQYPPVRDTGQFASVGDTGQYLPVADPAPYPRAEEQPARVPRQHTPEEPPRRSTAGDYRTGQFSFIEEPDDESEDVIDWLKFTESRTERREEARRRGRNRMVALVVVLALMLVGGVGYLWYEGKLPFTSGDSGTQATSSGPQKRDVIAVHLHNTNGKGTSTALLVDNTTTERGATILLPNSLVVTDGEGQTTTLGKSVEDNGSSGTRAAVDGLLGTRIEGSWRLDTPFLDSLVNSIGDIEIDTNADVPDPKAKKKGQEPLVTKGEAQTLSGPMAVAYATYRAPGESETAQLERFGAVLRGVLRKLSTDPKAATTTIETLGQIIEPPLTEKDLGAFLARLSERAKGGDYDSAVLPVQQDGTVSQKATETVVEKLLGGAVKNPDPDAAVRISLSGSKEAVQSARVDLVNGGWTVIAGSTDPGSSSRVTYADETRKAEAQEVAKTLGLPAESVKEGKVPGNADVGVVLGSDYEGE